MIAFDKFACDTGKTFNYVGIERNPLWHYVHGFLCSEVNTEYSPNILSFIYGNAVNIISCSIDEITANIFNILVLNYVLSSIYYSGANNAISFCNDIIDNLLANPQLPKPFFVLINDINTLDIVSLMDNFAVQL